ncbi:MAG: hypothetical protein GY828_00015 [Candidatus Gracilibacteria bacterium]|nr:hypothetical protein [Candidatus Gracilibacteria bacterium]
MSKFLLHLIKKRTKPNEKGPLLLIIKLLQKICIDLIITSGDQEKFELKNLSHHINHIRYNFQPIEDYINICFLHSRNIHHIQNICTDIKDNWEIHLTQEKFNGKVELFLNDSYFSEEEMLEFGFDGRAIFTHIHKLKKEYFNEGVFASSH